MILLNNTIWILLARHFQAIGSALFSAISRRRRAAPWCRATAAASQWSQGEMIADRCDGTMQILHMLENNWLAFQRIAGMAFWGSAADPIGRDYPTGNPSALPIRAAPRTKPQDALPHRGGRQRSRSASSASPLGACQAPPPGLIRASSAARLHRRYRSVASPAVGAARSGSST